MKCDCADFGQPNNSEQKSEYKHLIDIIDNGLIDFSQRWILIAKDNNTFEIYNYTTISKWFSSGRTTSPQTRAELVKSRNFTVSADSS